jgi:MFS family permease
MMKELGFSIKIVNNGYAAGSAALAVGAIMFIPFALKYGRRPMYVFSLIGQIAVMVWSAKIMTAGDLIGTNICSALFGALAEVIVQMTVAGMYNFAPSLYVQPLTLMQTYSSFMKEA